MTPLPAPSGLPSELTSFVGREADLALVSSRLAEYRLVTLVGPGGCGKTRLGVEVGRQALTARPGGVCFVDLSGLSDPDLVPSAVLSALGLRGAPGRGPVEVLVSQLGDREVLVLLDNCEHVVGACAALADAVVRGCPRARLLATSRERLGVPGEAVVAVGGLELPVEARDGDAGWLERSEAGRLFIDRARMARADFTVDGTGALAIARVCERLDGIPLALELAAARVAIMSVGAIAEALSDRFRLLVARDRTSPPRHKTLLGSIEWSCGLLGGDERLLFHRLSVFASGFTLAAAEAVCAGGEIEREEVLELLTSLVDKSLVQALPGADRFRLHETMRAYAGTALETDGVTAAVRDRHLDYFTDLAKALGPETWTREFYAASAALRQDLDNVRAALDWSMESKKFDAGAGLMGALETFFHLLGLHSEAWARAEGFLAVALEPSRRADVLNCGASFLFHRSPSLSLRLGSELVALGRSTGEASTLARGLVRVAAGQARSSEPQVAVQTATEAVRLARETGQQDLVVMGLWAKGWSLIFLGRPVEALMVGEEALRAAQDVGWAWGEAQARSVTSWAARCSGRLVRALEDAESVVQLSAELDPELVAGGEASRALALLCLGRDGALDAVSRARSIVEGIMDPYAIANYEGQEGFIRASLGLEGAYEILLAGTAKLESLQCPALCVSKRALLAELALRRGDVHAARCHLNASAWRLPREADPAGAPILRAEARLARAEAQLRRAHALACDGLKAAFQGGALLLVVELLELVAITCADLGRHAEAARLLGTAELQREVTGYARWAPGRDELAPVIVDVKGALGQEQFEQAWSEGGAVELGEAVAYARRGRAKHSGAVAGWDSLTPTERRVVDLVANRLTNAEIAQQLFVSTATVKSHLTRVFAKLGVPGRRELAALVASQDPDRR